MGIEIVRRLAHKPSSVPDARAALSPLELAVDPHTFETLRLLTELVTATVRHGTPSATNDIELWVSASRERIRVEVADSGGRAHTSAEEPAEMSELGLHLVETLSDRCGTEALGCDRFWLELVDSGAFTPESKRYAGVP